MARFTNPGVNSEGIVGPQGATGESAYQVALNNGFEGTEQEWLDSLKGADGSDGANGADGSDGAQGVKGDKGDTGLTGATGAKGDKGDTGERGLQGDQGIQGAKGDKGDTGEQGIQGAKGDKGDQGVQGETGPKGDTGSQGLKGDTGAAGTNGTNGADGSNGTNGTNGADGADGDSAYQVAVTNGFYGTEAQWLASLVGAQGSTGQNGADGADGVSFVWQGPWDVSNTYNQNDVVSNNGNSYIALHDITTPNIISIGDSSAWQVMAVKGAQGEAGADGADGQDGLDAVWNFIGAYDPSSSYAIGDLVTYAGTTWYRKNANGGNIGDTPAQNVYWTAIVEKGATGATGEQGIQGATGPKGDKGDTGEQGIQGIKGDKGDTGSQGVKGDTGLQGVKGDTGLTGATGATGPKGDTGEQGIQGVKGDTGLTGAQGIQGIKGDKGDTGSTGASGDKYFTHSTSTLSLSGSGQVTLTVETGLAYSVSQTVLIAYDETHYMHGSVYSYNSSTGQLVVDMLSNVGTGTYSSWAINIDGATGATGPQGATGLSGATGAKGDTGATGAKGDKGDNGLSAYQVAQAGGFTGTQTEWLASLIGPQGESGVGGASAVLAHDVKAGEALTKGQAVYVSSADGTNMIVSKSSNTAEATSSKTLGLISTSLSNNGQGTVITEGLLSGLDTHTATAGDPVWLGTNGNLIYGLANKPIAPAHLVFIGIVTKSNNSTGEIFVRPQNGFELNELHDVLIGTNYSSTPADNDILSYDTATSLWKNQTAAQAGLATLAGSETLTNKTLTTPILTGLSTIDYIQSSGHASGGGLFNNITDGVIGIGTGLTTGLMHIGGYGNTGGGGEVYILSSTANEAKRIEIGTGATGQTTSIILGTAGSGTNAITINGPTTLLGTTTLPSATSIGSVSSTEIGYLDGVTSSIQTQIDGKAAGSHAHTVSDVTQLSTQLAAKAPLAAPTFTGNVILPSTTSIGTISSIELGYIDGVTGNIQAQLDEKSTADKTEILTNKTLQGDYIEGDGGLIFKSSGNGVGSVQLKSSNIAGNEVVMLPAITTTLVGIDTTHTLTNKTINFSNNTISMTKAELNTAVSDADIATLAGTETLTNKTLTAPIITAINTGGTGTSGTVFGSVTTGGIGIGNSLTTGNINIAPSSLFNASINIATGTGTVNKTINIATNSTAGTTAVNIGSSGGATSSIALSGTVTSGPISITQAANSANHPIYISSANRQQGGSGYVDILKMTNSASGATNGHKWFRISDDGTLQILNSGYTAPILSITDGGFTSIAGSTSVSNGIPTNNAIALNSRSYIYDDGNMHINSASGSMWIDSNDQGAIRLNTQGGNGGGVVVGGKITADNTGDSGWIQVTSFNNNFSATQSVYYRKLNSVLYIKGVLTGGTANSTAFTLPTGYRPASNGTYPTQNYGSSGITYITVNNDGTVQPAASSTWLTGAAVPIG